MTRVATLICNPQASTLTPSIATIASGAVNASRIDWLAEGVACDIVLPQDISKDNAEKSLREAVGDLPIDVVIQPLKGRKKKMLIADMDSTMIEQECIDELADEVGIKERVATITARAMNGEIAFEPALRERVALLEGLELAVVERVIEERITLTPGGRELLATMNAAGAHTALVSGGFDVFTGRLAATLGFREHRANRLIEQAGRLAGKVAEPILGRQAKADALKEMAARLEIQHSEVMAVGDGANDLDMLRLAGAGVALHAKPAVAAEAGMRIDHADLTALLYIQGYRREEFVT